MAVDITVINSNIHISIQFPPDTFCLMRSLNIIADLRSCSYKLEINWQRLEAVHEFCINFSAFSV